MKVTKRVAFLPAGEDGCALWRMGLVHNRYPGSVYIQAEKGKELPLQLLNQAEVAIVQRLATPDNEKAIKLLKARNIKVVYDLDDDFWALPKYNPAYNIFRNPEIIRGLERCAQMADVITVSTSYLATVVKKKVHRDAIIIENAIDTDFFCASRRKVERDVTLVGWAGTPTHHIDLDPAMNALSEVLRAKDNVDCEFMGAGVPEQIAKLVKWKKKPNSPAEETTLRQEGLGPTISQGRVRWRPWVLPNQFPAWYSNLTWDIVLAPLAVENQFNRCKSNIKILEAAAVGIVCLASPTAEYKKFCNGDPVLESLLCKNRREWKLKISHFIDHPELRSVAVRHMKKRMEERYLIWQALEKWNQVFENA